MEKNELNKIWCEAYQDHKNGAPAFQFHRMNENISYTELMCLMQKFKGFVCSQFELNRSKIALSLPRNFQEAVVILTCLLEGSIFIPLDLRSPVNYRLDIMASCRAQTVVCLEENRAEFENNPFLNIIVMDGKGLVKDFIRATAQAQDEKQQAVDDSVCYILHTSGSTGMAKGVCGTYAGLLNRLEWGWEQFPFASDEVVCRRTPLVFVDSLVEIFGTLLKGRTLLYPPEEMMDNPASLPLLFGSSKVNATRLTLVPSLLAPLLRHSQRAVQAHTENDVQFAASKAGKGFLEESLRTTNSDMAGILPSLKIAFVSGEVLHPELVKGFADLCPTAALVNLYGSTEVAGDVTWATQEEMLGGLQTHSCIGRPLANIAIYLLDAQGEEVPDGVQGSLVVGGVAVAKGYIGDGATCKATDHSSQRFQHSLEKGLLFNTGDIVFKEKNTQLLYYVGRKDSQVKVRGVRLCLQSLEMDIKSILGKEISEATLLLDEPSKHNKPFAENHSNAASSNSPKYLKNDPDLAKLILFVDGNSMSPQKIKQRLSESLARYAIPSVIVPLDSLPKTHSQKIDKLKLKMMWRTKGFALLSSLKGSLKTQKIAHSATKTEQLLLELFSSLLDVQVSKAIKMNIIQNKSFYDLGGHSLASIEVISELQKRGIDFLNPHDLSLTIAKLAAIIDQNQLNLIQGGKRKATELKTQYFPSKVSRIYSISPTNSSDHKPKESFPKSWHPRIIRRGSVGHLNSSTESIQLEFKWSVFLEKCVDGSPLGIIYEDFQEHSTCPVVGAYAFIGSHSGKFCCIDVLTGEEEWSSNLGDRIEATPSTNCHGNKVWIGCYDGCLYCFEAITGQKLWSFQTQDMVKSTPVTSMADGLGDVLFFGSYDRNIYCLTQETGLQLWQFRCAGPIYAHPTLSHQETHLIVASLSGDLYALDVRTTFNMNGQSGGPGTGNQSAPILVWQKRLAAPIFSSPLFEDLNDCVVVGSANGSIFGISADSGALRWEVQTSKPVFSSPCLVRTEMGGETSSYVVIGSHDQCIKCINVKNGALKWNVCLGSEIFSVPFVLEISNGPVSSQSACKTSYNIGQMKRNVFVTDVSGVLSVVDFADGKVIFQRKIQSQIYSSPIAIGNNILFGSRNNLMNCFSTIDA